MTKIIEEEKLEEEAKDTSTNTVQSKPTLVFTNKDSWWKDVKSDDINIIRTNKRLYGEIVSASESADSIIVAGHSATGYDAIIDSAKAIEKGISINCVLVVDDGTPHAVNNPDSDYSKSLAVLGTNKIPVYFISTGWGPNDEAMAADAKKYVETGGFAVIITNTTKPGHTVVYSQALMDNMPAYLSGSGELKNGDKYKFEVYDKNGYNTYTYEEFKAKIDSGEIILPNMTSNEPPINLSFSSSDLSIEKVASDDEVLQRFIDEIRDKMKETAFFTESSIKTYISTTLIPNEEGEAINSFFQSTIGLLSLLESDTQFILEMGLSLKNVNESLAKRATEIGDVAKLGEALVINSNGSGSSTRSGTPPVEEKNLVLDGLNSGMKMGLIAGAAVGAVVGGVLGGILGAAGSFGIAAVPAALIGGVIGAIAGAAVGVVVGGIAGLIYGSINQVVQNSKTSEISEVNTEAIANLENVHATLDNP